MSTDARIQNCIDDAASAIGSVWPLHSFVTANPLAGFEDQPFADAVEAAAHLRGGRGYPGPEVFRRALESGRIDPEVLRSELADAGYEGEPSELLEEMAHTGSNDPGDTRAADERVDAVLTKWLARFLDQGQADWSMPSREDGFYESFRTVARLDDEVPDHAADLPDDPAEAIRDRLGEHPDGEWTEIFEFHLTALPGWTGLIKRRRESGPWQSRYPITLREYLAVRLVLADAFDAPIAPPDGCPGDHDGDGEDVPLEEVWLRAWEATYRSELVEALQETSRSEPDTTSDRSDAQLVFCIDTRSEIIRRHIEATGAYETHGFAGFFGVPMRYTGYDSAVPVDACPPILEPEHRIEEQPTTGADDERAVHDRWRAMGTAAGRAIERLKTNPATAFSFVESAGVGYGIGLAARTLLPKGLSTLLDSVTRRVPDTPEFCEPNLEHSSGSEGTLPAGLTLEEKVEYAATSFELMGIERFARVVVFAGHRSQTANNPFDSSLDCGACAGNPGGPSARVLAAICNDEQVKTRLRERGIEIPGDTVFVAGQHNTTTDEVRLYDGPVPESHEADIAQLRADLSTAREGATAERARDMGADPQSGIEETSRRAVDWAETRPEWGLAGNASFVIGPRRLTADLDLDGRAFLHSYDWRTDPDGDALEAIVAGPLVVTQWINTQYYFATVDNAVYGSGSKITQNPVGNVGVYQGNGGDLMSGLPLQSVKSTAVEPYHQPLRLSAVIHAPKERVTQALSAHPAVATLLDNGWLSLTVVDPTRDHEALQYAGDLEWTPVSDTSRTAPAAVPPVADD